MKLFLRILGLAAGAVVGAGCVAEAGYGETHFRCDIDPACPAGFECRAGFCEAPAASWPGDASAAPDPDAAVAPAVDGGIAAIEGPDAASTTTTIEILPSADAYVDAANPTINFGATANLRVDGSPIVLSYLRFDLSGVAGIVVKATLRLHANSSQATGFDVHAVADTTWREPTITYALAPAMGAVLGSSGPVTAGLDAAVVLSALDGGDVISLGLSTSDPQNLSLGSKGSATPPSLVLEVTGP